MSSSRTELPGLRFDVFEFDPSVVYALDAGFRITYCNGAWDRFAAENGGERCLRKLIVGRSLLEFIPEPLRPFYTDALTRSAGNGTIWEHSYDCSDPQVRRRFHMRVLPLGKAGGLLVINSQVEEHPHTAPPHLPLAVYFKRGRIITMCSHCRRTQRPADPDVWDWVPEYVSHPPERVSHGLCGLCFDYHYRELNGSG
jgi:hypothetical protein